MPRNVWSAGIREFDESVARRDANRRLEEDRVRRARLDVQADEDRQEALNIRRDEVKALGDYRTDQNRIRDDEATRRQSETTANQQKAEALGQALDEYTKAVLAGDEQGKQTWGLKVLNLGGKTLPDAPKKAAQRAPIERDGFLWEDKDGVYTRGERLTAKGPAEPKDDPNLPTGFKQELDWFSMNGKSIEDAKKEIARKWNAGEYRGRYPRATSGAAMRYLESTYDMDPTTRAYAPASPWGGSLDVAPKTAAPPPAAGGVAPPAGAPAPVSPDNPITFGQLVQDQATSASRVSPAVILGHAANAPAGEATMGASFDQVNADRAAQPPIDTEAVRRQVEATQARGVVADAAAAQARRQGGVRPVGRATSRAYTGEVRELNGKLLGLVNGQVVELVKTPQGFVVK